MNELRALDHFVIAGQELNKRIDAYRNMGFVVGPVERHIELGSSNCIVYLKNTYLELINFGNADRWLTAPYDAFFESCQEGVPHISLRTMDADAAHQEMTDLGLNPDKIINARRKMSHPDGREDETDSTSFYMWRRDNPYLSIFLSEHRKPENIFVDGYTNHPNSAIDVSRLVYMSRDPAGDIDYFSKLFGKQPDRKDENGFHIVGNRGEVTEVLSPNAAVDRYGKNILRNSPDPLSGFCIAMHYAVESVDQARLVLDGNGVDYSETNGGVIVPASIACGIATVFEARN